MSKRPSFQFYPNDWTGDMALQSCSLAAQGLWINLMCRLHNSPIYGKLLLEQNSSKNNLEGKQIIIKGEKLARIVGRTESEISPLIDELTEAGVLREDENGIYYSKRMIEDERIRLIRANAGSKGGKTTQTFAKAKSKQTINQLTEQKSTPSSSSSSSNIINGNFQNPTLDQVTEYFSRYGKKELAETFWNNYEAMDWKKGITPIKNWQNLAYNWICRETGKDTQEIEPKKFKRAKVWQAPQ